MIAIQWEDVIGVLQTCKPYLIALGVLWIAAVVVMIVCMKVKKKSKKRMIRQYSALSMLVSLVVIVNMIVLGPMYAMINLTTVGGTTSNETTEEAKEVAGQIAEEGMVLLKNDGILPISDPSNINLFGWSSVNPAYGGTGSGGLNDLYEKVSLIDSLTDAGFNVNQELVDFYNEFSAERAEMSLSTQNWTLTEALASAYSDELMQSAKEFSDTAAIVLYNSANPMELGFVEKYDQIKAALWCQGPGNVGFEALGKILTGDVNPSGRTSDTFIYDMTAAPWWNNWEATRYSNMEDMAVEGMNSGMAQTYYPSFTNYVEGIYVGYKYYETADDDGAIDYDATVQYPFGYGLSYTTFTQEMSNLTVNDGEITFDVTVTNTGDVAGKDVVEIYYNPPYTNGGIEKATANLIDFEKTQMLEPGASETITITFDAEDMASYDMSDDGCYVLEQGDYVISVNSDSHTVLDQQIYTQDETVRYEGDNKRESDQITATNQFEDVAGDVTYLSRADGFANYDEATAAPASDVLSDDLMAQYHLNSNFDYKTYINEDDEMPTTGTDNGIRLNELRGADYDDERWELLLDQLTVEDMTNMIALSGYQTPAMDSVGKVQTIDADGPMSINNNFTGEGSIGFPTETMVACTWSKELAQSYGEMMGKMCREMNIAGWYAPGMNTHRTPFGARNYEYFSEDGTLSGYIASGAVKGSAEYGVYAYIKHFAMYEMNAKMVCVWSNEQAMREIYLKPFEICVKDGDAHAVMVSWSFIGIKWSGENSNLLKTVLRDEWGFEGFTLTDFFRNNGHGFMNADAALANGVDAMLSTYAGGPNVVQDPETASSVKYMRQACKNVMYTVVNSWVYEEDGVDTGLPTWHKAVIGADVAVAVIILGLCVLVYRKYRKDSVAGIDH